MTTDTVAALESTIDKPRNSLVSDTSILVWRNLKRLTRQPDMVIWATIQPIMFVVLFAYVFGGSVSIGGTTDSQVYREYLMGGIFVETMSFAVASTSVGLCADMRLGLIDRFRSLPIARSSVIAGRVIADLLFNVIVLAVLIACAFAVGWRIRGNIGEAVLAILLLLYLTFAMLWIGALIGLYVRSEEVANSAGLIWLFPITFLSNCFIDPQYMAPVLRPIADWNPLSAVAASVRGLFHNPNPKASGFPGEHPLLLSLIWLTAITVVFSYLAIRRYQRTNAR
jgi:ABC-2 type transport system permease protein